jgi:CRISPR/Cas system CSM-associated protein Csm4 (group 5 of RAMP superfamily)
MQQIQEQLIDFLQKAYELSTAALKKAQAGEMDQLSELLDNRERSINIINSLTEKLTNIDDIITSCLQHEKEKTQNEIAKAFQNKENFKGYNLNNTK